MWCWPVIVRGVPCDLGPHSVFGIFCTNFGYFQVVQSVARFLRNSWDSCEVSSGILAAGLWEMNDRLVDGPVPVDRRSALLAVDRWVCERMKPEFRPDHPAFSDRWTERGASNTSLPFLARWPVRGTAGSRPASPAPVSVGPHWRHVLG